MKASADSIPTRKSLLDRLKRFENEESWREFFDTYWSLIYSMAVRSGLGDSAAQDVVQETFICVARSMPTFQYDPRIGSFKAWLRKLTRWRILDHVRANGSRGRIVSLETLATKADEIPDETDDSFNRLWDAEWRKALVDAAVAKTKARVDEKQFQIFELYALQDQPVNQVAAILRISQTRVYVAKHRVGKIFEQEMKALGLEAKL